MSTQTTAITEPLDEYLVAHGVRETEMMRRLRAETAKATPHPGMQIGPNQGQFMALLVEIMGARRILEIGTFTGYSAMWLASAMPEGGKLIACDINEETTAIAKRYWQEAGLDDRIELRLGPAIQTLEGLASETEKLPFDLCFIDADKTGYDAYYEKVLPMTRPGGVILFDNMLSHGRVIDASNNEENVVAIRAMNEKLIRDERVSVTLAPVGDGLSIARKR